MNRHLFLSLLLALFASNVVSAETIKIEPAFKQGIAFLLTIPGIPQLYYGQELLMNGTKEKGDGFVRLGMERPPGKISSADEPYPSTRR